MDDNVIELDIEALRNACKTLIKAYEVYKRGSDSPEMCDIYADSCVKRFEYTFETAWKIMKKYFKLQYGKTEEELTMNNIFRFMEGYGFTDSWVKWKEYYAVRCLVQEKYNINNSREFVKIIPDFIQELDNFCYRFCLEKDLVKVL